MKKLAVILLLSLSVFTSCNILTNSSTDGVTTGDSNEAGGGSTGDPSVWEDLSWTVGDADVNTYSANTKIGRVTLYATGSASIVVDANSKTIDDINFTHRCKLGGTGLLNTDDIETSYRVIAFPVIKNSQIKIYAQSASSTSDRDLQISNLSGNYRITKTALGANISCVIDTLYTGDDTTLYLYSLNSGINIYGIYVIKQK
ncbi:MAG: hypothetical protein ACOZCE_08685 [Spirochaetota bacterium]